MRINPYAISPLLKGESNNEKEDTNSASFGQVLGDALNKVNSRQVEADKAAEGLISGDIDNLHDVMIASEKAQLSLNMSVQVVNKAVDAYNEISRMQL